MFFSFDLLKVFYNVNILGDIQYKYFKFYFENNQRVVGETHNYLIRTSIRTSDSWDKRVQANSKAICLK